MFKRPFGIILIFLIGLIVGLFNIFVGTADLGNIGFLFIGLFCIILSYGIFMLWDWARKGMLYFSVFIMILYLIIIIFTISVRLPMMGIGLVAHLPILLFIILIISYLNKKTIKDKFTKSP